jgi:hypothetical protein
MPRFEAHHECLDRQTQLVGDFLHFPLFFLLVVTVHDLCTETQTIFKFLFFSSLGLFGLFGKRRFGANSLLAKCNLQTRFAKRRPLALCEF